MIRKKIIKPEAPEIPEEKPLRYKKITGGLHRTADGRNIRKDEVFTCLPSQMPKMFASSFICLDKPAQNSEDAGMRLTLKPVGKNKWNLINSITGLPVNNTPMSAQQARTFLDEGEKLPEGEEEISVEDPVKNDDKQPEKGDPEKGLLPEEEEFDN